MYIAMYGQTVTSFCKTVVIVLYVVNRSYGRTIRGGNAPLRYEYIAMYGQQSPASVKQCVSA
jgi:hypothetical protein